jgi:Domain of unknown function (DUF5655)/Domain of unknown function (DUF4287)
VAIRSRYGVHPGVMMMQKWAATLPDKTGRSVDQWLTFIEKKGPKSEKERRVWLKDEQGLPTNTAWWLAAMAEGTADWDGDPDAYLRSAEKYVEDMFGGGKAGLRPLYEKLLDLSLSLGKDVKACPGKTIVPIYRSHVIAQIKPSTRTRIDFGLALGDTKGRGRLVETGGFAKRDRITHRIEVTSLDDIDDSLVSWLRKAYERDSPTSKKSVP